MSRSFTDSDFTIHDYNTQSSGCGHWAVLRPMTLLASLIMHFIAQALEKERFVLPSQLQIPLMHSHFQVPDDLDLAPNSASS